MSFEGPQQRVDRGVRMRKEDRALKKNSNSRKSGRRRSPTRRSHSSHHKVATQTSGAFPRTSGAFPRASDSYKVPANRLEAPTRVVVTNNRSPSKTKGANSAPPHKKVMPATPEKQPKSRSKTHKEPTKKGTLYHSPESIKLRVPGSSRTEPKSPPSLFHSPEKLWKTLRCTPTPCRSRDKENSWAGRWMDQGPFQCGDSSCGASSAVPSTDSVSVFATRLTPDTLQQHDSMIRRSPDRAPKFSGDKLAATVITKKTKLQLEKERIEKAQEELELFVHTTVIPATRDPCNEDVRKKHWIEMERQRVLQQKWQRKKQEQMVRTRAEQLRQAELERQRKLQVSPSTPIKKRPTLKREASPATPRTHHLATRKMIEI